MSYLNAAIKNPKNALIFITNPKRIYYELKKTKALLKYRAIYYPIPKCANSTLKKGFKKPFYSVPLLDYKRFIHNEEFFKFTFVRNPYDRIVSLYEDKINVEESDLDYFRDRKEFYPQMSFKEFVKVISKIPDEEADRHFKSLSDFITDENGEGFLNFIGTVENIQEDYKTICDILEIKNPEPLPHIRKSKRKKDYREYYDEETKKLIQKRYKKDFELLGYKF